MELTINSNTIQSLKNLQSQKKFAEEGLYSGAPNESIRTRCEKLINELLEEVIVNIEQTPQKEFVMNEFMKTLAPFDEEDTEEREQACEYLERIMTILDIESSDGKINEWLYGFDFNE